MKPYVYFLGGLLPAITMIKIITIVAEKIDEENYFIVKKESIVYQNE
jgi:hypothetical protein